jgi:hypothetical protein
LKCADCRVGVVHNSELSRAALGYEATTRRLERLPRTCHPSNRADIEAGLTRERHGDGPTLFDEIVEIIRAYGPSGDEPEDGISLELV